MTTPRYRRELGNLEGTSRILLQEKKLKEVIILYERCLSTRRADLGDLHPDTIEVIVMFAKLLGKQKQKKHLKASRKLYEEALDYFMSNSLDEFDLKLLRIQHSYAVILGKLEAHTHAKRILEKLLGKFQAMYANDKDHDYILNTYNQLASVVKKSGNLRGAKTYYERAYYGNNVRQIYIQHYYKTSFAFSLLYLISIIRRREEYKTIWSTSRSYNDVQI